MTHWYREPKRVKLMELLERANLGFVLRSGEFSEDDLQNLRATLRPIGLAERGALGTPDSGDPKKVLIIAPRENPDLNWLQNPKPWAGIFSSLLLIICVSMLFITSSQLTALSTMARAHAELSGRVSFSALFLI
jgi:hypothetical protein